MNKRILRFVAGMLIGVLLFAQMAVASYTCPRQPMGMEIQMTPMGLINGKSGDATALVTTDQMANCEDMASEAMDPDNANLCTEHCKFGQQSDQTSTLTVPTALLMALYSAPLVPDPMVGLRPAAATPSALAAASPPHTILHCCFRI